MRFTTSASAVAALTIVALFAGNAPASAAPPASMISTDLLATAPQIAGIDGAQVEKARHRQYRRYQRRHHRRHGRRHYRGPSIELYFAPRYVAPPVRYYTPRRAGSCGYWQVRCSANWTRYYDIKGCLRYYGCY